MHLSNLGKNISQFGNNIKIIPNITSVNEGSSVTFTITANVPNGTNFLWSTQQVLGTVNSNDFTDFLTSDTITINNNSGTITRTLRNDLTLEGTEGFKIILEQFLIAEQSKISGPIGAADFGFSIAIDGDTAIVGAYRENGAANNVGAAYIYIKNGSTWELQQRLQPSIIQQDVQFGYSVAISGNTVIVGARFENNPVTGQGSNTRSGAAYIYVRSGTTWTQQRRLVASTLTAVGYFGHSVAIDGDTVVIGQPGSGPSSVDAGRCFIFFRSGTTWTQQANLIPTGSRAEDFVGSSVAISGNTVVIGASLYDHTGLTNSGAAYVYIRSGSSWSQQGARFLGNDPGNNMFFGSSVAINNDVVVIGAPSSTFYNNIGSVYVFIRSGSTWSQQAKLQASDSTLTNLFGQSVSLKDNVLIVGSPRTSTTQTYDGAVYAFVRSGNNWFEEKKITVSDPALNINFGTSLSIGNNSMLIGTSGSRFDFYDFSLSKLFQASSPTVTINDTSVPTYAVAPNVTSVNEGSSVTFTVSTQGVANGTTLFWSTQQVSGTINASDFTDNVVTGSFTINNNTASIVRSIRNDTDTEGSESFRLRVHTGSTSGTVRATSATVTINDTSIRQPEWYAIGSTTNLNSGSGWNVNNIYWKRSKLIWVYSSQEIQSNTGLTSGLITNLRIFIGTRPLYQPIPNYQIGMKNISDVPVGSSTWPGDNNFSTVRFTTGESFTSNSFKTFPLNSPGFQWTGGAIAVQFAWAAVSQSAPGPIDDAGTARFLPFGEMFGRRDDANSTFSLNENMLESSLARIGGRPNLEFFM
jgi:hypothetical protein